MYYVYLLKAINSEWIYVGYTSCLKQRMLAHEAGKNTTTKRLGPMKLVYYEAYGAAEDAKERERQLKNYGAALGHLKNRVRRSLESGEVAPCFPDRRKCGVRYQLVLPKAGSSPNGEILAERRM